jgi:hypothetical protein
MPVEPSSFAGGGRVLIPSAVLFFALAFALLAGGFVFGRCTLRRAGATLGTGVLIAALNLLILLSLREQTPLAFIPGSVAVIALVFTAGAGLGRLLRLPAEAAATLNWRAALSSVAVAATLLLLLAGGVVTGFQAGLAVPDWPSSFGHNMFLFPLAHMTGGIFFEHVPPAAGLAGRADDAGAGGGPPARRARGRWVRVLALGALGIVIVQGTLGGLRVTQIDIALAITHGVLAQVFFSTLVSLRVFLSTAWRELRPEAASPRSALDLRLLSVAVALLLAQILLGALQRHVARGLHFHLMLGGGHRVAGRRRRHAQLGAVRGRSAGLTHGRLARWAGHVAAHPGRRVVRGGRHGAAGGCSLVADGRGHDLAPDDGRRAAGVQHGAARVAPSAGGGPTPR